MASPVQSSAHLPRRRQSQTHAVPIAMPRNPNHVDSRSYATISPTSPKEAGFPASFSARSPGSSGSTRDRASSYVEPKPLQNFVPVEDSFAQEKQTVKALLLENVNESGIKLLRQQNYIVDTEKASLGEDALIKRIREGQYQILGIRSKTKVTKRVIDECHSLLVIGCFCIGTNQVDLQAASQAGIAVFNSPFSNSRSVAELVIAEIIALSRQLCDRATEMRQGVWNKVSKNCWEVRNKTLGIVGYGHIGSQLSVLAEAFGMDVLYFDVIPLMPLGSANQVETLDDLLAQSDFVSLHVPELPETVNLISTAQIQKMKKGSYLINNARGTVVDIPALIEGLKSGILAGAAVDVFPKEPAGNGKGFDDQLNHWASELQALPNVVLTPHIGGSTEEAQTMIGSEVGTALIRYVNFGSSLGAVNFPEVNLKPIIDDGVVRLCHVHHNQPGVLKAVNAVLGEFNVERQLSDSKGAIAYLMADISEVKPEDVKRIYSSIMGLSANVATRILY